MKEVTSATTMAGLRPLLELAAHVGGDPLLTQASTGNISAKLDGTLWIKASGKWMADALHDDFLVPLDLAVLTEAVRRGDDPIQRYSTASIETAMHAVLPHPVVLHIHCVNTIAWAVRRDAQAQLERRLEGMSWQWIPYALSGLPLAREMDRALSNRPDTDVFVLGNHGLVLGGRDAKSVELLLNEVRARMAVAPREAHPADYAGLMDICADSPWDLPDDDGIHALGTDRISQKILAEGLLYPCQAILSDSVSTELYRPILCVDPRDACQPQYRDRPFLVIERRGVVVRKSITPIELAMISGLSRVVQRLGSSAAIRYLTEAEIGEISGEVIYRYREVAAAGGNRIAHRSEK